MATQSEQILEDNLVAQLIAAGYTRVAVTDEASMLANLKLQVEDFNHVARTDAEFTKVLSQWSSLESFHKLRRMRLLI